MSDIVEHLRDCAEYADEYPSDKDAFNGAAKEITRLREENARLRELLKELIEDHEYMTRTDAEEDNLTRAAARAAIRGKVKDEAACPEPDEAP